MSKLRVFMSWSGPRSKHVANALHEWLPDVLQNTAPFFSDAIEAGSRWFETIGRELSQSEFAVLCITRENAKSPWVNFEAGACSKKLDASRVVPYLIDGRPTDYEPPLSMFQSVRADEAGTLGLLKSLNAVQGEDRFDDAKLSRLFEPLWPRLKGALETTPLAEKNSGPARTNEDMFAEILALLRGLAAPRDPGSPPKKPPQGTSDVPWVPSAGVTVADVIAAIDAVTITGSQDLSGAVLAKVIDQAEPTGLAARMRMEQFHRIGNTAAVENQLARLGKLSLADAMVARIGRLGPAARLEGKFMGTLGAPDVNPALVKWGQPQRKKL